MTLRWIDCLPRYLLALMYTLLLAACGGGGGSNGGCSVIDPNRDPKLPGCGTSNPTTPAGKPTLTMTALDASGATLTTLAPGGSATLTAVLQDANAAAVPNTTVTFTSTDKNAVFSSAGGATVTDGSGKATIKLSPGAASAAGGYVVTASASVASTPLTVSANYSISAAPAASASQLVFVSALPQNIALKGTGGAGRQETATVTFKVMDTSSNVVGGQQVNFALNTTVGGLTLTPASAVSSPAGLVTTSIASGTINTPVRVTATLSGSTISTVSDQLVVSTGVAEQNSFSLSAAILNVEGGQFNGCTAPTGTNITARLADHFHNPVPDGTAVSFTAEGGSIDASCLTGLTQTTLTDGTVITQKGTPGECTVRFCAGNPRPADGRVTVLAYALGEESFVDANGNNRYDAGEAYTDLGEPFRNDRAVTDANANGIDDAFVTGNTTRASGEQYIDTNGNGSWDLSGDGRYNGVLQTAPASGAANSVHVRQSLVMVLSNSTPAITLLNGGGSGSNTLALDHCTDGTAFTNNTHSFYFAIRDNNPTVFATNRRAQHAGDALWQADRPGNPLPAGTRIAFTASNGLLQSPSNVVVANGNGADSSNWVYTVAMISDASQTTALTCGNINTSGVLNITITTPNGTVTQASFPVTD
ncbi:Ig-like domain (group 1) [Duganella sacchari]|uniref:Ig-like domain (Group 1) n=1 Tax=Duganella sacchari TaxID=551987 RepID=A0A1M7R8K8_9BURK|nr:Ig-like domain-containing protein [Duganella sacchari]SHN42667.1 Ig-like domain (group 1) [Duganella sacchari]